MISQTNTSLVQAGQDTDLGNRGTLSERAIRCRVNKYSGQIKLSDLAGNVCGLQNQMHGAWSTLGPRYVTSKDWSRATGVTNAYISNNRLRMDVSRNGSGDTWVCGRSLGTVSVNGYSERFRLTGTAHVQNGYYNGFYESYLDLAVVGNASGFMAGAQTISFQKEYKTSSAGGYDFGVNEVFDCYSQRPYIQIAMTLVRKGGGIAGNSNKVYTMEFSNIKLEKV
jgi:hypothetical protein